MDTDEFLSAVLSDHAAGMLPARFGVKRKRSVVGYVVGRWGTVDVQLAAMALPVALFGEDKGEWELMTELTEVHGGS